MYNTYMSILYNKNLNPLLNSFINCIFVRSTPHILSIKGEYTFRLLNFLITGLCNSLANCLFEVFSFSIPLPEDFYWRTYRPLKQVHVDIHHILDFWQYEMLFFFNIFINIQLQHKKIQSPDIIYSVCPGVK